MPPPILIVGAGRSGTKLLREILGTSPSTASFPREINYIWRYGNAGYPTDELRPEHARTEVVRYIRSRFRRFSEKHRGKRVVEKTCANALRVGYVHRIFPDADIIHLVRDGRAVAESARRRWKASPSLMYLLEKFRWVPVRSMPFYLLRYLRFQIGRLVSEQGAESSWGPRFEGIDQLVSEKSLLEVCGLQWKACVRSADDGLRELPPAQTYTIMYKDLVLETTLVIEKLFQSLGIEFAPATEAYIRERVEENHIHKWKDLLSENDLKRLMPHIREELNTWGYQ